MAASKARGMEEGYWIRSLSAPMRLSATGEVCNRLYITQGNTHTIGRSRRGCDVVFDDTRVSRKHCQLRVLPQRNILVLLDGVTTYENGTETDLGCPFVEKPGNEDVNWSRSLPQKHDGALDDGSEDLHIARKLRRKANLSRHRKKKRSRVESPRSREIRDKSVKEASGPWRPSLNGIFVNGREFCARMMILMPGDEVSLVGPTEGGKSLDSDCPVAIGFVVEVRPMGENAQPGTSCLSPRMITQYTVGDNFSAPYMGCISNDVGDGSLMALDSLQNKLSDFLPQTSHHNQVKDIVNGHKHAMSVTPIDGNQGKESDTQTGDSSTKRSIKLSSADPVQERNSGPDSSINIQGAQVNEATSSFDWEHKLLSTFNLVRASIRLRSDLLSCYTSGSSHTVVGQKELLVTTAGERVHSSQEILDGNILFTDFTKPVVKSVTGFCGRPFNSQAGDCEYKKDVSFSLEHTVKVDSVPSQQIILQEDSIFVKNVEGYPMPVLKEDASLLPNLAPVSKQGGFLRGSSLGNCLANANSSHFTRTLLVPPSDHTFRATNFSNEMLNVGFCDRRVGNGNSLVGGSVSGNPPKDLLNIFQTLPEEGGKDKTAKEAETFYEHSYANDVGQMRVEAGTVTLTVTQLNEELSEAQASSKENFSAGTITLTVTQLNESLSEAQAISREGGKYKTAKEAETFHEHSYANDVGQMLVEAGTVTLTVTQLNEELSEVQASSKENFSAGTATLTVTQLNEKLSEAQASSKENFSAVHHAENICTIEGLIPGQALTDELRELNEGNQLVFWKNGQVPVHITVEQTAIGQDICCHSPATSVEKVEGDAQCLALEDVQQKGFFAVQELGPQESGCSLHLQCTCTLGSPRTDVEVISAEKAQGSLKSSNIEDVQKGETCAVQELRHQEMFCSFNVQDHLRAFMCEPGLPAVEPCLSGLNNEDVCKEQALECTLQGKVETAFESSILEATSNKEQLFTTFSLNHAVTRVVCKDLERDNERSDNGATQEADENIHRHDLCCTQSLAIDAQVDEVVDMIVSKVQTSGYYLNQLEDVTAGASNQDNTIRFWDLLALTDDVQALFITTFTYDMEWFLSSAGLSRDIPVTVACHNGKHCWSKATKDRCEKPYLDWPNVTLVYPPFPRNNAFGRKGQGIGCHHPKVFLVRRTESLRVIVSSANLTYKQWFHVTNNVWWQDFSCRQTPDFGCLFRGGKKSNSTASPDFASQLAMFLAALLVDAPSEAHWVTDLAAFDFSDASGSLVASVPGLHQPLYQNAPQFLVSADKEAYYPSLEGDAFMSSYLGVVPTTVAGIKYRFCPSADRNGTRIRCLAAALNDATVYEGSTMPVLLKRAKFLKADPNAVSVIVTSRAKHCSQDLFLQEDLHDAGINTMDADMFDTEEGFIKLGFLPRDVASWLAVLCDQGFFSFAACIWPSEALAVASGQRDGAAKLALYVFQGPRFSSMSPTVMTSEECGAFSGLLKSLHNTWGLWRLEKVLCQYNWVDSCESDFYVASSSIGTSLDAKFLAAFAAAAGRKAESMTPSQESDPQWGCWTAEQEAANPSIGIVFPTIDRVRQGNFLHYGLLCFAESAWLRLKSAKLLHDAVPHPPEREGFPMHIKVARRRFQDPLSSQPYGWMYCGSHNFSPAAWGRPIWRATDWEAGTDAGSVLGSSLHICNYELGIVLMEPPPDEGSSKCKKELGRIGLDRYVLPFKVPPPLYRDRDRPATGRAMMEAYMEMRALQLKAAEEDVAVMHSEDLLAEEVAHMQQEDEAAGDAEREEARAEQVYVEVLWTQIDDEDQNTNKELIQQKTE